MPERIRLVGEENDARGGWHPNQGEETTLLLSSLRAINDAEKSNLVNEAGAILGQGVEPGVEGTRTGLVVGFVQGGKTASFTAVTALARDNRFRLVIVITGVSTSLLGQSNSRLVRDLQIETRDDRSWRFIQNPALRGQAQTSTRVTLEEIQDTLNLWNDPYVPSGQRQALLITVMKHHLHLRNLTDVLSGLNLAEVPTLVIDDEADQAGLNNRVHEAEQSTTYRKLLGLRRVLPAHTYLQYTATPQAPLLISIADALSPDFVRVLIPGEAYTGGQQFFIEHPELIRVIPSQEIITANNQLVVAPGTLLQALQLFFLGVAAGIVTNNGRGNRSMLVHPSQGTLHHRQYYDWILATRQSWLAILRAPADDRDRVELLVQFEASYHDLANTVGSSLPLWDVLRANLPAALMITREKLVNAVGGRTPTVQWRDSYSHILVGGQAMDRGFTVEGLTVTYMPRGVGTGNADTIQQRARFFGYKQSYLGYCRVFLEEDTRAAFKAYVTHERDMRSSLAEHAASGRPLSDWKRKFLLDPMLKATRDQVISLPNMRYNFVTEFFRPRVVFDAESTHADANRTRVEAFERRLTFSGEATGDQTNLRATGVPIRSLLEDVFALYTVGDPADSWRLTALLIQLQQILEQNEEATCTVYIMGRGHDASFLRRRPVDPETGMLAQTTGLFQGRNASGYPGDEHLPTDPEDRAQLQIHHLSLRDGQLDGDVLADDVCVLACRITPSVENPDVIVQTD